MDLSLNRLPWYGQIGAFVVVAAAAVAVGLALRRAGDR